MCVLGYVSELRLLQAAFLLCIYRHETHTQRNGETIAASIILNMLISTTEHHLKLKSCDKEISPLHENDTAESRNAPIGKRNEQIKVPLCTSRFTSVPLHLVQNPDPPLFGSLCGRPLGKV